MISSLLEVGSVSTVSTFPHPQVVCIKKNHNSEVFRFGIVIGVTPAAGLGLNSQPISVHKFSDKDFSYMIATVAYPFHPLL
jgi:hypothetical protein